MTKILLADDDPDILDLVCFNLERAGYNCVTVSDGMAAVRELENAEIDLAILDIMMPGLNGLEILQRLRSTLENRRLPVVLLTARGEEVDRVVGFELGADDYVTKPFSVRELVLRVQRLLEHAERTPGASVLRCGDIRVDLDRYEASVGGSGVLLTTTEFNLLVYLLKHRGRVVSRDKLLDQVWGYRYTGTTRTVDTHVQRLREKLGESARYILTVRGVGYKIDER
ncbi:MAG TPA: response regulator transcription factor [Acidobacteriota bacterium]|nr:response regulator transcription factor [Acidobacteriota bacterium]HRR57831.1 response regulator transcription factor [Acidobacteriota bacterium]HRV08527.1 response regulator transcription factor [Acidobacteriota bacterium]